MIRGGYLAVELHLQHNGILFFRYETTATTLAFTTYLISQHPEVQDKLQDEIDSIFDQTSFSPDRKVSQLMIWYQIRSLFGIVNLTLDLVSIWNSKNSLCSGCQTFKEIWLWWRYSFAMTIFFLSYYPLICHPLGPLLCHTVTCLSWLLSVNKLERHQMWDFEA